MLADLLSLSPSLSPSHSDLHAGGARLDDRWAQSCRAPAPGLACALACAVSRRAVRGGADPALRAPPCETDKVYTCFAIGVQEAEKVCSKFTCRFAYSGKSLHLVCNWCTVSRKEFAQSSPVSLHTVANVLHWVCTWFAIGLQEAEKFTCQFAYSSHVSLHTEKFTCQFAYSFTLRPKCLHQRIQNSRKGLH